MSLYKYKKKNSFVIKEIPNIQLLKSLGVCVGLVTMVVSRMPLGGPVLITVGKRQVALGKEIADKILVEEVC
ncbi:iron transporter FeoA [Anaerobacillus alkalidiazotrophicus]|uniref:Iron transporter FeoA n=1 Tax=Anaerobacillus alkalidiazotrophicus TaxID=472963 RepID=A0A1S2MEF4_9BACI|nr:FeoA family protein [Anaerobacillus alkalidiazotrophicus]OIJ22065.1 iron transporter FeoA [Anaerobacillus alkalidiazotrophicus]